MKQIYDNYSLDASKLITNKYSTSFSFSTKLLGKSIRPAIYSIYGLVRLADEIVDSFHGFNKDDLLLKLKKDYFDAINNKISLNPLLHSFQDTYHKYDFEPDLVEKFFHSMEMDLSKQSYTDSLYKEYIHGSAEVVGLMCLKVFVKGDAKKYLDLKYSAMKLGSAFQKVNFLRDLEFDNVTLGRTYFPNVNFEKMTNEEKKSIINNINKDFDDSLSGLKLLDKDSFLGVYVAYRYYKELLNKINNLNLQNIKDERIRISNLRKISLILNSKIKLNMGLI